MNCGQSSMKSVNIKPGGKLVQAVRDKYYGHIDSDQCTFQPQ